MRYLNRVLIIIILLLSLSYGVDDVKFSFSLGSYYLDYHEIFTDELYNKLIGYVPTIIGEAKSHEYGWTPSISTKFDFIVSHKVPIYIETKLDFSVTALHTYDGSRRDTTIKYPSIGYLPFLYKPKGNNFFHGSFISGYKFNIGEKSTVTPTVGIRYNRWGRPLFSGQYNYSYDIQEVYHWIDITTGTYFSKDITEFVSLHLQGYADFMVYGLMEYRDKTIDGFRSDNVVLGNNIGGHGKIGLEFKLTPKFSLIANGTFRYYSFGLSETGYQYINGARQNIFIEPDSKSYKSGYEIIAQFSF